MNTVCFIGRLGQNPELKYTAGGKPVCNFPIAVDTARDKPPLWLQVVVWNENTAKACAEHLIKGRQVGVSGYLQVRTYEKRDGGQGTAIEVVANRVDFLGGGEAKQTKDTTTPRPAPAAHGPDVGDDDIPF